jgi:CDP-6-deoxy-D-xylo-4-hexulose-3-dehydrase
MENNLMREDLDMVIEHLKQPDPILTHSKNVLEFEKEWSQWLGVKHSVMVNSGASANEITMCIIKELYGEGEVIVPPITWVSDISAVLFAGLTPVFCDITLNNLAMDPKEILKKITPKTRAVFMTHVLGYNGLSDELIEELKKRNIPLIEDVCESHGACHKGVKLGSIGFMSNFSYYYAHHMTTIEGGMICTNDDQVYEMARMFRSHGMVREAATTETKKRYHDQYPDLNPDFIFAYPAHNMRSTEINGILGRSQLKRLDSNNDKRRKNLEVFLANLDKEKFYVDFDQEGSCNYAFTLVLREANQEFMEAIMSTLRARGIEFRRGLSGGGNQLRQPYLRKLMGDEYKNYPVANHVHFYGVYIGNYPSLEAAKIKELCEIINAVSVPPKTPALEAIVLAGGLGTRLRPVVGDRPKVMAEVAGRPFLSWILSSLKTAGVTRVILSVGYMSEKIEAHFGNSFEGVSIVYSKEQSPLGTGGALAKAAKLVTTKDVLVLNGDSLVKTDLKAFYNFHRERNAATSMLLTHVSDSGRFGSVEVSASSDSVLSFSEKNASKGQGWINGGMYLISTQRLASIAADEQPRSLERDILPLWVKVEKGVTGYRSQGEFLDIGTPESFKKATSFVKTLE